MKTISKIKIIFISCLFAILPYSQIYAQKKNTSKDNTVVFYITRHGKTMLNTLDRVQGWADTPLTHSGIEVAEFLGVGLQDVFFKSAYSSDLGRARQTARIVLDSKGQKEMNILEVTGVRETNFGSYEGAENSKMWGDAALYLHYPSFKSLFEDMVKKPELLKEAIAFFKVSDTLGMAEDYEEVKARGQKAIKEIAEKEAATGGGNVLLVSHGMAIGIFLSDLDSFGKKVVAGHMGNAAVSKLIYKDGKFTLESFGDMSYVEKGKSLINK